MASFSDSPLEIIEEIIDNLQDQLPALRACSQTCHFLLPLCRKYIFRSISLKHRSWQEQCEGLPRHTTLFATLLDSSPDIADYVQNLVYQLETPPFTDPDALRILKKLHRIQSFQLLGENSFWNELHPTLQKSLLHIIHLRSVTHLKISYFRFFSISTLTSCVNLTDLTLSNIMSAGMDACEHEYFAQDAVPQLQSFTLDLWGRYGNSFVNRRGSKDFPMLDFSNLQTLSVIIDENSDIAAVHALTKVTEKLETLYYSVDHYGLTGLAASMNLSSFSTLKRFYFELIINDDIQDPLCGFGAEITAFSGHNVIEEINLEILVQTDCQCTTDDRWGMLDSVLATGFPMLSKVSLNITISVFSSDGTILQENLNKLPKEQFPWLSKNSIVMFEFSTEVHLFEYPEDYGEYYF